jgi:hypothetical protein
MASSSLSVAKPAAGRATLAVLTAVLAAALTFVAAIFSPVLALAAAGGLVAGAVDQRRAGKASAPMLAAAAVGCVITVAAYTALAIANAEFGSSSSNIGTGTESPPGVARVP